MEIERLIIMFLNYLGVEITRKFHGKESKNYNSEF